MFTARFARRKGRRVNFSFHFLLRGQKVKNLHLCVLSVSAVIKSLLLKFTVYDSF